EAAGNAIMRLYVAWDRHQELKQIAIEVRKGHLETVHRAQPRVPFHALQVISPPTLLIDCARMAGPLGVGRALVFEALAQQATEAIRKPRGSPRFVSVLPEPPRGANQLDRELARCDALDDPRGEPAPADAPRCGMLLKQSPLPGSTQVDQIIRIREDLVTPVTGQQPPRRSPPQRGEHGLTLSGDA